VDTGEISGGKGMKNVGGERLVVGGFFSLFWTRYHEPFATYHQPFQVLLSP
jgi:hypothetical protein